MPGSYLQRVSDTHPFFRNRISLTFHAHKGALGEGGTQRVAQRQYLQHNVTKTHCGKGALYVLSMPDSAPAGPMMLNGEEPNMPHAMPPQIAVRKPEIGVEPLAMPRPMERARDTSATRVAACKLDLNAS